MNRTLLAILLLVGGLLGLFMTACGGFFTVTAFAASGAQGILAIAAPSLLAGLFLLARIRSAYRTHFQHREKEMSTAQSVPATPSPPPPTDGPPPESPS